MPKKSIVEFFSYELDNDDTELLNIKEIELEVSKKLALNLKFPKFIKEIHKTFSQYNEGLESQTEQKLLHHLQNQQLSSNYYDTVNQSEDPHFYCYHGGNFNKLKDQDFFSFISKYFPNPTLRQALISDIYINLDIVNLHFDNYNIFNLEKGNYYIPIKIFEYYWQLMDKIFRIFISHKHIIRSQNFGCWHMQGKTQDKFFSSPIAIYNQDYDIYNLGFEKNKPLKYLGLEYLDNIVVDQRREKFILGTISYEIGNNIYANQIWNTELELIWRNLINKVGDITNYAQLNKDKKYSRNFAETIRIYTTNCSYLQYNYFEIYQFIKKNFPTIKKDI